MAHVSTDTINRLMHQGANPGLAGDLGSDISLITWQGVLGFQVPMGVTTGNVKTTTGALVPDQYIINDWETIISQFYLTRVVDYDLFFEKYLEAVNTQVALLLAATGSAGAALTATPAADNAGAIVDSAHTVLTANAVNLQAMRPADLTAPTDALVNNTKARKSAAWSKDSTKLASETAKTLGLVETLKSALKAVHIMIKQGSASYASMKEPEDFQKLVGGVVTWSEMKRTVTTGGQTGDRHANFLDVITRAMDPTLNADAPFPVKPTNSLDAAVVFGIDISHGGWFGEEAYYKYFCRKVITIFASWDVYVNSLEYTFDPADYLKLLLLSPATGLYPTNNAPYILNYNSARNGSEWGIGDLIKVVGDAFVKSFESPTQSAVSMTKIFSMSSVTGYPAYNPVDRTDNPTNSDAFKDMKYKAENGRDEGSTDGSIRWWAQGGNDPHYGGYNPGRIAYMQIALLRYYERLVPQALATSYDMLKTAQLADLPMMEAAWQSYMYGFDRFIMLAGPEGLNPAIEVVDGTGTLISAKSFNFHDNRPDNLWGAIRFDLTDPYLRGAIGTFGKDLQVVDTQGNPITVVTAYDMLVLQWEAVAWLLKCNLEKLEGSIEFLRDPTITATMMREVMDARGSAKPFLADPWANPFLLFDRQGSIDANQAMFKHVESPSGNPQVNDMLKLPVASGAVPLKSMLAAPATHARLTRSIVLPSGGHVSPNDLGIKGGSGTSALILAAMAAGAIYLSTR